MYILSICKITVDFITDYQHVMLQTHGDLPVEVREKLGITEDFLRLSVGIENADDLIADLEQALA